LAPAVERFRAKKAEEQDEVRDALDQYVRAYSFLSQVVDFGDVALEALYLASRALLPSDGGGRLDLGSEVELTHLRLEKTSETQAITPDTGTGELKSIYSGRGPEAEEAREHLSAIIGVLNERFGLALGTADQLFFDQMEATWLGDPHLVAQARANPLENFRLVFADRFIKSIVERMDDNADIFGKILDEPAFQAVVMEHYLQRVFEGARTISDPGQ
jgi:type I restriction enzyme R subunit